MNSILKALLIIFCIAIPCVAIADAWTYHHVENGWFVYGNGPDFLHNNDGWWYRKSCNHLYACNCDLALKQIRKIESLGHNHSSSVTDKLGQSLEQLAVQKGKTETLLVLNDAEQLRLRSLASALGFYTSTDTQLNSQYGGYNNNGYGAGQVSHVQRGNTIYGFDYTYDGLKDPFEDLKVGAELTRLSVAAREHRESSDVMQKHLVDSFNLAVDRYAQLKGLEMHMVGQGANFKMHNRMQPKEGVMPDVSPADPSSEGNPPPRNPKVLVRPGQALIRIQRMQDTMRSACVRCHDGTPASKNKTLNLTDVTLLTREQFSSILDRISTSNTEEKMPQGGPYLSKESVEDFQEYQKLAFPGGKLKLQGQ